MEYKILQGDSLEKLKELQDNSIDSIVTDPPYHLTSIVKRFGKENSAPAKYGKDGSFGRLSKGFMGKEWDGTDENGVGIAFNVELWKECLRVLKPGGHLLAFSGSRTYHRMAVAIEDAGFEIRDQIMWVYGSGFPKSLNIGKAVDKIQGNEREVIGKIDTSYLEALNKKRVEQGYRPNVAKLSGQVTKGDSPYEKWGTALKPAHEPIVMARKPISETNIAQNVLKYNTGGINIDDCRIESGKEITERVSKGGNKNKSNSFNDLKETTYIGSHNGRFPSNFIHDGSDEVVSQFPDVTEDDLSKELQKDLFGNYIEKNIINSSRFFYCAKAGKEERNLGLEGFENRNTGVGALRDGKRENTEYAKNHHPTVKPIKLMEYLVKLVTPKGATVLDVFCGSGSTGCAAVKNGFNFIGIELTEEYIPIAEARIKYYKNKFNGGLIRK